MIMDRINKKIIGGIALVAILAAATFALPSASADLTALDKIGTIINIITNIQTTVNSILTEVTNIEGKLDGTVPSKITEIDTEVDKIEGKLDGTEDSLLNDPTFGLEEIKNEVKNIEGNTYIPFRSTNSEAFVCAEQNDFDIITARIESEDGKTFVVNSIALSTFGVDNENDDMAAQAFDVDGLVYGFVKHDITGNFPFDVSSEILGTHDDVPEQGDYVANQLVSLAGGSGIEFEISCEDANNTAAITIPANGIMVSGWKEITDTINVDLFDPFDP